MDGKGNNNTPKGNNNTPPTKKKKAFAFSSPTNTAPNRKQEHRQKKADHSFVKCTTGTCMGWTRLTALWTICYSTTELQSGQLHPSMDCLKWLSLILGLFIKKKKYKKRVPAKGIHKNDNQKVDWMKWIFSHCYLPIFIMLLFSKCCCFQMLFFFKNADL